MAIHGEDRKAPGPGVVDGHMVEVRDVAEGVALIAWRCRRRVHDGTTRPPRGVTEGVVGALPPGRSSRFGPNEAADVDQQRLAGDANSAGVAEEREQELAGDDRINAVDVVLREP